MINQMVNQICLSAIILITVHERFNTVTLILFLKTDVDARDLNELFFVPLKARYSWTGFGTIPALSVGDSVSVETGLMSPCTLQFHTTQLCSVIICVFCVQKLSLYSSMF